MIAIGIDIIEIKRIENAIRQWQQNFLKRIYTERETEKYMNMIPSLAARFAAKEATMKALGKSGLPINWREIEVLSINSGAPTIQLYGQTKQIAESMGIRELSVSLSHCQDYAVATVVGYAG